ncbi:MAG: ATP-dependent DNA helicase RecG [Fimbriimonadales bacterium]|nr:MAG: ATP-dependent DNA helicase RecG [Fimbriimonadales bacterium]
MDRGLEVLRRALGDTAQFRDGQWEAIAATLEPGARQLVVQRTGWGKSIVYFVCARLLRDQRRGMTLVVSPLLALMRNQIELARRFGLSAETINSTNQAFWDALERRVTGDQVDILFVSPERLGNEGFQARVLPHVEARCGLLVIDEAHCISDWGHDFRPDYRRILHTVRRLNDRASVLCTTATANDRVIEDIRKQLGPRINVRRGPLMRKSLELHVLPMADQAERLAWLAHWIPRIEGSGIVYTLTINDARRVAEWLRRQGVDAREYHAELENEERQALEGQFSRNEVKCLVATTALGMGYDKSDVAFVIHFQMPGSVINYYQQVGRAGRSLERAKAVLLTGSEDAEINEYFIQSAFPGRFVFDQVLNVLRRGPASYSQLVSSLNIREKHLRQALELLTVEEVVRRAGSQYELVNPGWRYEELRSEQITAQRHKELQQMHLYAATPGCRMRFLAEALDDPYAEDCGKCDRCSGPIPADFDRNLALEAVEYLRGDAQPIARRAYYPPGVAAEGRKKIPEGYQLSDGIALSVYNDAGWGREVAKAKYGNGEISDELIQAAAQLIVKKGFRPDWLCWVPSLKRPQFVPGFARRLAAALGVPAVEAVRKVRDTKEQKEMQNSTAQFRNVEGAFRVQGVRPGRCLLVDDVVDSGWTMTAIGIELRKAGCAEVIPFALAVATSRS